MRFLSAYVRSHLADDAANLKATLLTREEAHSRVMASDDLPSLRAFLNSYPKGSHADQVRERLQHLEPPRRWYSSMQARVVGGLLALVFAGLLLVWLNPSNYGDELTDFGVPWQSTLQQTLGSNTPTTIPYAYVIKTSALNAAIQRGTLDGSPFVLIDVLADVHSRAIPGAI